MSEEFQELEAELRKLRPSGLDPVRRAALLAELSGQGTDDAALEEELRRLRPAGFSEAGRQRLLAAVALSSPRPRLAVRLVWAAAAVLVVGLAGAVAMQMKTGSAPAAKAGALAGTPPVSKAGSLAPDDDTAPLQVSLAGVHREFSQPERVNSYLLSKTDGELVSLPDGCQARRVTCDYMDEIEWRSNKEGNRSYIEQRPRREVMYIAVPVE